eukprot:snap_masked-scaffold_13-processed-gene-1.36-mRNA-1 protein AED:1.00 eAED:1.00 QI:0/0/0/0/1/1/2/0/399
MKVASALKKAGGLFSVRNTRRTFLEVKRKRNSGASLGGRSILSASTKRVTMIETSNPSFRALPSKAPSRKISIAPTFGVVEIENSTLEQFCFGCGATSLLLISGVILLLAAIGSYAKELCPILDEDNCLPAEEAFLLNNTKINIIIHGVFCGIGLLIFLRASLLREYQDPFNIILELQLSIMPPIVLVGLYLYFILSDRFSLQTHLDVSNPDSTVDFQYELLLEYACLYLTAVLIWWPGAYVLFQSLIFSRRVESTGLTLLSILQDPEGKDLFREHLISEFSVENLYFYEAASLWRDQYHEIAHRYHYRTAQKLFNTMIRREVQLQINISDQVYQEIEDELLSGRVSESLFDNAIDQVFDLMDFDSFPRFKQSADYKAYVDAQSSQIYSPAIECEKYGH